MHVIDSHTGGMPTRVILEGSPDLGSGPLSARAEALATEHQDFCNSVLLEPRGQAGMVAALLVEPVDPDCVTGVIYFDADAVLGMCGHGTIGLAVTLAHMGRISQGAHRIETPAGVVTVELHDANTVSVTNIESRRIHHDVAVEVEGHGAISGDMAYGGNWFFIANAPLEVSTANIPALTALSVAIRESCNRTGVAGREGQPVDHVILSGASPAKGALRRNFVLCPDDEYDRSPCGTGSSAFVSCLAAADQLAEGEEIVLESVIGSSYKLSYRNGPTGGVIPKITGQAYVMAESRLVFAPDDPFKAGIV
ncbi:proline racemase family protein [Leisingera methylohalidivorans]|uniref:Hydroxyproline-2-epimerase n=1 Tax=Leisingera methylohalidivorans DSM 14336 TaxID=999552 RepID=V9VTW7_9RHOB|nr:proline racemase family protein [Leisingera methylohalidivorans]AHD02196.1 hydroxyproline-2-epimerase [Leisingera methylohalidivorans DSM 14336]